MHYYILAMKGGWFEVRKALKPLNKVETKSFYYKDTRKVIMQTVDYYGQDVQRPKLDSHGRFVYKKARQKVNLTVTDWEGGKKVATVMAHQFSRSISMPRLFKMQPGDCLELSPEEIAAVKKTVVQ